MQRRETGGRFRRIQKGDEPLQKGCGNRGDTFLRHLNGSPTGSED